MPYSSLDVDFLASFLKGIFKYIVRASSTILSKSKQGLSKANNVRAHRLCRDLVELLLGNCPAKPEEGSTLRLLVPRNIVAIPKDGMDPILNILGGLIVSMMNLQYSTNLRARSRERHLYLPAVTAEQC